MKIFKIIAICFILLFLCSCKEYGEKRVVKLLAITKDEVTVLYYNYDNENISYDKITTKNLGVKNSIIDILKNESFNTKLCNYCIVDEYILKNNIFDVFMALNGAKFSPDINIVAADQFENLEIYLKGDEVKNPLYNIKYNENTISTIIPSISKEKEVLIVDNIYEQDIENTISQVIDILTENKSIYNYDFTQDNANLSCTMEDMIVGYDTKGGKLFINIYARLVSYRGISSGEKNKKEFIEQLTLSLKKNIKTIYSNKNLVNQCNLLWYYNVEKFDIDKGVDIKISIK